MELFHWSRQERLQSKISKEEGREEYWNQQPCGKRNQSRRCRRGVRPKISYAASLLFSSFSLARRAGGSFFEEKSTECPALSRPLEKTAGSGFVCGLGLIGNIVGLHDSVRPQFCLLGSTTPGPPIFVFLVLRGLSPVSEEPSCSYPGLRRKPSSCFCMNSLWCF